MARNESESQYFIYSWDSILSEFRKYLYFLFLMSVIKISEITIFKK